MTISIVRISCLEYELYDHTADVDEHCENIGHKDDRDDNDDTWCLRRSYNIINTLYGHTTNVDDEHCENIGHKDDSMLAMMMSGVWLRWSYK